MTMATAPIDTQGIRSLTDVDSIYAAFDSYPWIKDETFKAGLYAILGDPNTPNPQGSPTDIATHARIFYYTQRVGVTVDFAKYQSWLAQHPDHNPPQVLPEEYLAAAPQSSSNNGNDDTSTPHLPWQQAAPKAPLFIDRSKAPSSPTADDAANEQGGPNYPSAFAEMLKALQEGKEVPGIRQIPNTVARGPSVRPIGSKTVPRKPWEKHVLDETAHSSSVTKLEMEFPPVDEGGA